MDDDDGEASVPHRALAQLVRDLADAVVIADPNGTMTFWNEAACRLFGWPADEVVSRSLDLTIPERFRRRQLRQGADPPSRRERVRATAHPALVTRH